MDWALRRVYNRHVRFKRSKKIQLKIIRIHHERDLRAQ